MNLKALKEAAERAGGDAWDLVAATEHHGPYVVGPVGDICDFYTMSNPSLPSTRNGGKSYPVPFYYADENAAFVALANPSTILSLIERVEAMEEALTKLRNEVRGLAIGEEGIRNVIGNTNWNVLMLRAEEAGTALSTITKE